MDDVRSPYIEKGFFFCHFFFFFLLLRVGLNKGRLTKGHPQLQVVLKKKKKLVDIALW